MSQMNLKHSLQVVEGYLEKTGDATAIDAFAHVERMLKFYQQKAQEFSAQMSKAADQKTTDWIMSDKPAKPNVKVFIDAHTQDDDDTDTYRHWVHIQHEDGSDNQPARAFRYNGDTCIETWRITRPYVFTLTELKALVQALEAEQETLPFEEPADDALGTV